MVQLTPGQHLALDQLAEIADRSGGALEIRGEVEEVEGEAYVRVRLSLETAGYRTGAGFGFRDRERLVLLIYDDFPFKKPELYFNHTRFAGQPHIQWGTYICLYQSPEAEYQPADGMFGFFERVDIWMAAAGDGTLDPEDAPLHPPVAYATSATRFIVKADTPPDDLDEPLWIGRAELKKVRNNRFDIIGWTALDDWAGDAAGPIAATILLKQPLTTEYPIKVYDLIKLVQKAGLPFSLLYRFLRLFSLYTPEGEPGYFVLGAPMRRKAAGEPLRPHLTVWEIAPEPLAALRAVVNSHDEDEAAHDEAIAWLASAAITWCTVMEDRPEIVHRRDGDALAATFTGKRVLLLGCGAIGSAVAEAVVRAGAASLCLADKAVVKTGVLVRQRYTDADIGLAKANALKVHLDALGLQCAITAEVRDLADGVLSHFAPDAWDLVIDATASTAVHHRLERELAEAPLPIPLISMAVSAAASHGSVAVKMPGYRAGPIQIARQAKIKAFARDAAHPLVKAFWPAWDEIKVFQPEPGCSAPTFIGSAADIDYHSAGLLNVGLLRVKSLPADQASMDLVSAPWMEGDAGERSRLSYVFAGHAPQRERRYGYTILRSEAAKRGMAEEMRRIARKRSNKVETGGLMFGEADDSHRVIFIDSVSGPPADSKASAEQFLCGTAGTKEMAAFKAKQSGGSSRFIGIWHTHPVSPGRPSGDDLAAMIELLHLQDATPRQVVMLIVGFAATNPGENYYLFRRNEFRLIGAEEVLAGGDT